VIELRTPIKINGRKGRSFAFTTPRQGDATTRADITALGHVSQTTHTIVIDRFCTERGIGRVDFIRCDVEGAEGRVLAGADAILERDHPSLLIELHPTILATMFASSAETVRDSILARGYRMFRVEAGRLIESPDIVAGGWADYFFIHPRRASDLPDGPFRVALAGQAPHA
jgi:hypothetical protein